MAEETACVPPASPLTKSKGGDKRRSFEAPRSSTSSGKGVPHYLRASTGSRHEFCKHGKKEEHDSEAEDSRPWRKPVTENARDMQQTKEGGVAAVGMKTVAVKPKPSADPLIKYPGRDTTTKQEISTTCENDDVLAEQGSSDTRQIVRGESKTSDGPETASSSQDVEKVTSEDTSSDAKDLSKKSNAVSKVKPSLRPPSPISSGPTVGRKSLDVGKVSEGKNGVDGRKIVEGRKSVDGGSSFEGRKSFEVRKIVAGRKSVDGSSFEGRKSIDGRKSIEGRATLNGRKLPYQSKIDPETTQNHELNLSNAENNSDGSKSADEMKSIEGSESSLEKKGSEEIKNSNLESNEKDDSLGKAKNKGKSEFLKKHVAVPKPKISTTKPPSPLHPLPAKLASPKPFAVKPPPPLRHPLPAKSPSHKSVAVKLQSPLHPSGNTPSRTGDDSQGSDKVSTSELDAKIVGKDTTVSPSSKPSLEEEKITNTKKVRVVRVISSVRKQSRLTKVAAKDPNDKGVQDNTADASKTAPEKKSPGSGSSLPPAPSLSKTTIRSRITYTPSRFKKSLVESEPNVAAKDAASASILRKGKAVDLDSENHRPTTTLKAWRTTSLADTAQINRRSSLKKRVSAIEAVKKNSSDSFLLRRPSSGRKKNVTVLFNKVIEETASRLARTRKSKVLALVGAFETVISIQNKSSAGAKPKPRKISSLAKASC
uniref:Calmodulin-binding domain-containing protein n=1 Tax=Kalanchoe fedtschenkoi TaxID=63787 RepID=A0A7N0SWK1_KALFE